MAASVQTRQTDDDLIAGTPFDLGAAQTGKSKSRAPEVLVGIFLVALFALVGAWFYSTSTSSTDVIGLRNNVQRGATITDADLARYEVGVEGPLTMMLWAQRNEVIGKKATADLSQGMLLHPTQFGVDEGLPDGQSIVGLSLSAGQYPSETVSPNDIVRVIYVPSTTSAAADQSNIGPAQIPVLVPEARVVAVGDRESGNLLVSLQMSTGQADTVSAAGAENRVHLIQVRGSE